MSQKKRRRHSPQQIVEKLKEADHVAQRRLNRAPRQPAVAHHRTSARGVEQRGAPAQVILDFGFDGLRQHPRGAVTENRRQQIARFVGILPGAMDRLAGA